MGFPIFVADHGHLIDDEDPWYLIEEKTEWGSRIQRAEEYLVDGFVNFNE